MHSGIKSVNITFDREFESSIGIIQELGFESEIEFLYYAALTLPKPIRYGWNPLCYAEDLLQLANANKMCIDYKNNSVSLNSSKNGKFYKVDDFDRCDMVTAIVLIAAVNGRFNF